MKVKVSLVLTKKSQLLLISQLKVIRAEKGQHWFDWVHVCGTLTTEKLVCILYVSQDISQECASGRLKHY